MATNWRALYGVPMKTTEPHKSDRKATLVGGIAVLMWGLLAALTVSLRAVPPFQLLAMAFSAAFRRWARAA